MTEQRAVHAPGFSPGDADDGQKTDQQAAQVRIETYALLAALLRSSPGKDLLSALATIEPLAVEPLRPTPLEQAWQALAVAASEAEVDPLDAEFHDLFIGLGRGELLPYGSWYITGALMDKPLAALRDELARLGLERAQGVAESEDHAAAICETMALLADPEHGVSLGAQKRFFSTYAGAWLPRFFQDLQRAERASFYAAVGRLGEAFVDFERVWLDLPE